MVDIVHPKTGHIQTVPEDLPLAVYIKEEDGKIVDVKAFTHKVDWVDGGLSKISYCNNCGYSMFYMGSFKLSDGNMKDGKVCCGCGAWLGFFKDKISDEGY